MINKKPSVGRPTVFDIVVHMAVKRDKSYFEQMIWHFWNTLVLQNTFDVIV